MNRILVASNASIRAYREGMPGRNEALDWVIRPGAGEHVAITALQTCVSMRAVGEGSAPVLVASSAQLSDCGCLWGL